jgi:hypothetical protein
MNESARSMHGMSQWRACKERISGQHAGDGSAVQHASDASARQHAWDESPAQHAGDESSEQHSRDESAGSMQGMTQQTTCMAESAGSIQGMSQQDESAGSIEESQS